MNRKTTEMNIQCFYELKKRLIITMLEGHSLGNYTVVKVLIAISIFVQAFNDWNICWDRYLYIWSAYWS